MATPFPGHPQTAAKLRNFLPCFPLRCGEEQPFAVVPVLWTMLVLSENAGQVLEQSSVIYLAIDNIFFRLDSQRVVHCLSILNCAA